MMAIHLHGDFLQYYLACQDIEASSLPILIWHVERSSCLAVNTAALATTADDWGPLSACNLWSDRMPDMMYHDLHGKDNLFVVLNVTTARMREHVVYGWAFYPRRSDNAMALRAPVVAVWLGDTEPEGQCAETMRRLAQRLADAALPRHMTLDANTLTEESAQSMLADFGGLAYIKDLQGNMIAGTQAFMQHTGMSLQQSQDAPADASYTHILSESLDRQAVQSDNVVSYTLPNRRVADMIHAWRSILRFPLHNTLGETVGLFVVLRLYEDNDALALEYERIQRYFQVLHDVSDTMPYVLLIWRANGSDMLEYVSKSVHDWGYSPVDITCIAEWAALVHPEDRDTFLKAHTDMLANPQMGGYTTYRIVTAVGEIKRVHEEIVHYADSGRAPWMCSMVRFADETTGQDDFHRQKEINRRMWFAIEANQERDAMLGDLYHDLNHVSDLDGYLQETLTLVAQQFGLAVGMVWEINGKRLALAHLYEDKQAVSVPMPLPLPTLQDVGKAAQVLPYSGMIHANDLTLLPNIWRDYLRLIGAQQMFLAPTGHQHTQYGVICFFDMTQRQWSNEDTRSLMQFSQMLASVLFRKRMQAHLMQMAYQDAQLGIPNRQSLEEELEKQLARGQEGLLFLLDISNLKMVRNAYGMAHGDALLAAVRDHVKASGKLPYRFSNDEFAIILEGWTEGEMAAWADRLMNRFASTWNVLDKQVLIVATGGAANMNVGNTTELLKQADAARMTAATKEMEWMLYNGSQHEALFHVELAKDMHQAIAQDCEGFIVYYQPIYDLQSQSFLHAEALLRWYHPQYGLLSPAQFMDVAEETGLIIPLTHFVLREALTQVHEWQRRWPNFAVTVNLSRRQVRERNTVTMVANCLANAGVDPSALIVELTETKAIQDISSTIELFDGLRTLGVRSALDDFGVGFSSLSAINELPIDIIKIDKSFVQQGTEYDRQVMAFVAQVAQSKGIWMCTEGVETPSQLQMTKDQGSTHVQGFLISKPVPPAEAEAVIAEWQPDQEWMVS